MYDYRVSFSQMEGTAVAKTLSALGAMTLWIGLSVSLLGGCTRAPLAEGPAGAQPTVVSVENQSRTLDGKAALAAARLNRLKHRQVSAANSGEAVNGAFATAASPVISSQVTFAKAAILNRIFLYGSDLQYSTIGGEMLLQSIALGHVTARFQIIGQRLQLFAEEKYKFESNINVPLRLLHEWPIQAQTAATVTVEVTKASPALSGVFGATNQARNSWVRSVEFDSVGSYLLIESSMELADGNVAEFMESLFPRDTLIRAGQKPLYDDAELEPLAERFGFLSDALWTTVDGKRTQTAVASRFATPPVGQTIDWYVTSNVPPEYLPQIRDGVEGWNRYSQKMWGRDFIRFKGVLPAGVKIGDPRYNVINWDSATNASSAYESQATDPEYGIQSHSLIYLPYAWLRIGREFWERGQLSDDSPATPKEALEKTTFLDRKVKIRCLNDGELAISLKMKEDPETFASELLKGTLFHEVGHALGLEHNFKGSLEWDPNSPTTTFTTSIMDYNQYQLEGGAFDGPGKATGPLLEYDRQILSVLYNGAKDIAMNDRELPHCNDGDADSKTGGVDPFCTRYDSGSDPSVQLQRITALLDDPNARLGQQLSLAAAIDKTKAELPDPATIIDADGLSEVASSLFVKIAGLTQFYSAVGAQSVAYMLSANLKSLSVFRAGSLPMTTDAAAIRSRVTAAMDRVMGMPGFSAATDAALAKTGDAYAVWLRKTKWYTAASKAAPAEVTSIEGTLKNLPGTVTGLLGPAALQRARVRALAALARTPTAPFFLSATVDYEKKALGWLDQVLNGGLAGADYSILEKATAATTLKSFAAVPEAAAIKVKARAKAEQSILNAKSAQEREAFRALLAML